MSKVLINRSNLEDIASAIRKKNGRSTHYKPREMAGAIRDIPGGGYPEPTGTVTITQNGTHDVKDYASAQVNVQPNLQSKTATENGTVTPDSGYDGLSSVVVDVSGGTDGNVFNWKAWRGSNISVNNGTISFISDSEFEMVSTGKDCYTKPFPSVGTPTYNQCYPIVSGQKATLTWDYSGSEGNVIIYLENKWGSGNWSQAAALTGAVSITANRNTYVNFIFGINNTGGSGRYSNMRLTIE